MKTLSLALSALLIAAHASSAQAPSAQPAPQNPPTSLPGAQATPQIQVQPAPLPLPSQPAPLPLPSQPAPLPDPGLPTVLPAPAQSAPQPAPPQPAPSPTPAQPASTPTDRVNLQFPKNSIIDVLAYYESLTGKKMIRDSNLAGPELTIMATQPVSRAEAIKLIESSLLLNGYSIVPVDDQTIKVLGPSRAPRTEGLPLYIESGALPKTGDQVVSFYQPLAFIAPEEAIAVLNQVIQMNAYGAIAPVPNTNALIITDKTPVIRKALGVLALIDVEPAQVVTEFVPLQRANAERIVEILDKMFGKDDPASKSGTPANVQAAPPGPDGQPAGAGGGARYENRLISGKAKFLADKRTNRILVVTRKENYRYVRDVITQLDSAGDFEQPYVRKLNYAPVLDVFPVISDMLADADTDKPGASAQPTPSNPFKNTNSSSSQSGTSGSSGGSESSKASLSDESAPTAPQSVTLGEIKIIADPSSNSIIVFGPPESKQRAKQILDLLDQRPKQVYLAVIIGQLRITNDLDYGVNYLIRYQGASGNGLAAAVLNPLLFPGTTGTLPIPASITSPAALKSGFGALSGLTVFGTIADSVDVYARFLESTNHFQTLSRPVIYTKNNQKATIRSGQDVPFASSSLSTATGGGAIGNGSSLQSNVTYKKVELVLEVRPLINSDGEVNLEIVQTNDNVIGQETISGNQAPIISTQQITTSVRVPNGSTIVLGGLVSEDKDKNQAGLPFLSRVPVLGSLLGGRTNNTYRKKELIVLIQPIVVDSNPEMLKASAYEADRMKLGKDSQAMTAPVAEQVRAAVPWKPKPSPTPKKKKN